jgi:hypothetical protein
MIRTTSISVGSWFEPVGGGIAKGLISSGFQAAVVGLATEGRRFKSSPDFLVRFENFARSNPPSRSRWLNR